MVSYILNATDSFPESDSEAMPSGVAAGAFGDFGAIVTRTAA